MKDKGNKNASLSEKSRVELIWKKNTKGVKNRGNKGNRIKKKSSKMLLNWYN